MGELDIDFSELTRVNPDADVSVDGRRMYSSDGYYVTVRLSDLQDAVITEHDYEDGREPKRGIFVPFRDAGLTVTPKKNVLATFKMAVAEIPTSHHSHILTQVVDADVLAEWKRLGYGQKLVGFARPFGFKKKTKYSK